MKKRISKIRVLSLYDDNPDVSYLGEYSDTPKMGAIAVSHDSNHYAYFNPANPDYAEEDYKRMKELENNTFCMIGIQAEAEIQTEAGMNSWLCNKITSGGLWGIASDSDKAYLKEIGEEQVNELKQVLLALGFEQSEINAAKVEY